MGGRGAGSGIDRNSVFLSKAKRTIETFYRKGKGFQGGYFKNSVLEAVDKGDGNIEFRYAYADEWNARSKYGRTSDVTFSIRAGAIDGDIFGINWKNVKSVSGKTFDIKSDIKNEGFKWDPDKKRWIRK